MDSSREVQRKLEACGVYELGDQFGKNKRRVFGGDNFRKELK